MAEQQIPDIQEEHEDENAGLMLVELGPKFQDRIFYEDDDRHPGGAAHVVAGRVSQVYPTPRVNEALAKRVLKQSKAKAATKTISMVDVVDQLNVQPPGVPGVSAEQFAALQAQLATVTAELAAVKAQQPAPTSPAPSSGKRATTTNATAPAASEPTE